MRCQHAFASASEQQIALGEVVLVLGCYLGGRDVPTKLSPVDLSEDDSSELSGSGLGAGDSQSEAAKRHYLAERKAERRRAQAAQKRLRQQLLEIFQQYPLLKKHFHEYAGTTTAFGSLLQTAMQTYEVGSGHFQFSPTMVHMVRTRTQEMTLHTKPHTSG